jgi:hypothetical protein
MWSKRFRHNCDNVSKSIPSSQKLLQNKLVCFNQYNFFQVFSKGKSLPDHLTVSLRIGQLLALISNGLAYQKEEYTFTTYFLMIESWGLDNKTFYNCNKRCRILSWCICHCRPYPPWLMWARLKHTPLGEFTLKVGSWLYLQISDRGGSDWQGHTLVLIMVQTYYSRIKLRSTDLWVQFHNTFYSCNLRTSIISQIVCPWQPNHYRWVCRSLSKCQLLSGSPL